MHMLLRFIWAYLRRNSHARAIPGETTQIQMRVLPTDLDFLMHMNNGMYFSFMDFGRFNMIFRNGTFAASQKNGWYGVVAGEMIKFKKSLELWDKFTLETQVKGYDDKYFFIEQKFFRSGELMAHGMVKIRFLKKKGGGVSPYDVVAQLENPMPNRLESLGDEWYGLEKKHLS